MSRANLGSVSVWVGIKSYENKSGTNRLDVLRPSETAESAMRQVVQGFHRVYQVVLGAAQGIDGGRRSHFANTPKVSWHGRGPSYYRCNPIWKVASRYRQILQFGFSFLVPRANTQTDCGSPHSRSCGAAQRRLHLVSHLYDDDARKPSIVSPVVMGNGRPSNSRHCQSRIRPKIWEASRNG